MRRSTLLGLAAAVLVVAVGVYTVFWWIAAGRVKDAVDAAPQALHAQKIDASWRQTRVGGYPFGFRVELSDAALRGVGDTAPVELRMPLLVAVVHPWNLRVWRLAAPQGLKVSVAGAGTLAAALTATEASGAIAVAGDRRTTVWLSLIRPALTGPVELTARGVDLWAIAPPAPPQSHTEPALAVAVLAHSLALPVAPPGFDKTVDDFGIGLTLMGAVPSGPLRQALAAWRDAGGTLELDHLALHWGELGATASGTLALDSDLQPIGGFSGAIAGYDHLMSTLVAAGRVKANDARLARLALAMLAKVGPEGRPEISTSLTLQSGEILLGPAKLGRLPRIDW